MSADRLASSLGRTGRLTALLCLGAVALAGCGHLNRERTDVATIATEGLRTTAAGVDTATAGIAEGSRRGNYAAERIAAPLGALVEGVADVIGGVVHVRNYDPNATVFEGVITVSGGEFQLALPDVQPDLIPLPGLVGHSCISGALPRETLRTQPGLNGRRVRLTGHAAPWSIRGHAPTYQWAGTRIHNRCERQDVILAHTVEVLD